MSVNQIPETYVLFSDNTGKEPKIVVAEEDSYTVVQEKNPAEIEQLASQEYVIPSITETDDDKDLLSSVDGIFESREIFVKFINKAIKAKAVGYINRTMKASEPVTDVAGTVTGTKYTFESSDTAVDLTKIVGAKPSRERLSAMDKVNRLLGTLNLSPEQTAALLAQVMEARASDGEEDENAG